MFKEKKISLSTNIKISCGNKFIQVMKVICIINIYTYVEKEKKECLLTISLRRTITRTRRQQQLQRKKRIEEEEEDEEDINNNYYATT